MIKNIFLFAFTFVAGAAIALALRAASFKARPGDRVHEATVTAPVAGAKTVNTICAVCGMEVDPDIPPATYQGKLIGFGCSACPPKFAADPERYSPHALHNMKAP
ncbi:MAG: hypothetical protein U1F77_04915 [Kiritimatiellia bacterium]